MRVTQKVLTWINVYLSRKIVSMKLQLFILCAKLINILFELKKFTQLIVSLYFSKTHYL